MSRFSQKTKSFAAPCVLCGVMALAALLTGCAAAPAASAGQSSVPAASLPAASAAPAATPLPTATPAPAQVPENTPAQQARVLLAQMTLTEKVGQLFVIRPDSLDPALTAAQVSDAKKYGVTALSDAMRQTIKRCPPGGIAIFGKNIASPEQLSAFVADLKAQEAVPLLMCVDEEGGAVSRIANSAGFDVPKFESMGKIGASGDAAQAKKVGQTIGDYLKKYGFTLDFAPVADTNTNPKNIVIGDRSFGSDPALVAKMAAAEIEGLHQAGVMSCIKHFPGHGDTTGDTHDGYVRLDKSWEQLKSADLIPFEQNLSAADLVMVAHITLPQVTSDGLPASLSKELITGKLRGELGYQGVVITDSLAMGAVTKQYSSAQSAVLAFCAGADLLLMPEDYTAAFGGVYEAVQDGTISEERLDESVLRILTLKLTDPAA